MAVGLVDKPKVVAVVVLGSGGIGLVETWEGLMVFGSSMVVDHWSGGKLVCLGTYSAEDLPNHELALPQFHSTVVEIQGKQIVVLAHLGLAAPGHK